MTKKVIKYKNEGYKKFQLKVGGEPKEDIERIKLIRSKLNDNEILVADANTGWLMHDALKVVKETAKLKTIMGVIDIARSGALAGFTFVGFPTKESTLSDCQKDYKKTSHKW